MRYVALWLFILNLGVALGAGVFEHRIVVPDWISQSADGQWHWNAEEARAADTGLRFWVFVSTVPLTLLTLINLYYAWNATGPERSLWLLAVGATAADRLLTFAYFIPAMITLMGMPDSAESVEMARSWNQMNYLRHALVFVALNAAMGVFAVRS